MPIHPVRQPKIRRGLESHTFGMVRRNRDGTPRAHQGWDYAAKIGTDCLAIASGRVVYVREDGDLGLRVLLSVGVGNRTLYPLYAHLSSVAVVEGERVQEGQLIAKTGESGNAVGMPIEDQHLHFELRTDVNVGRGLDDRISPIEIYGAVPW